MDQLFTTIIKKINEGNQISRAFKPYSSKSLLGVINLFKSCRLVQVGVTLVSLCKFNVFPVLFFVVNEESG